LICLGAVSQRINESTNQLFIVATSQIKNRRSKIKNYFSRRAQREPFSFLAAGAAYYFSWRAWRETIFFFLAAGAARYFSLRSLRELFLVAKKSQVVFQPLRKSKINESSYIDDR